MGKINRLYKNSKKPFKRLWNWAEKKSGKRFNRLKGWAKSKQEKAEKKADKAKKQGKQRKKRFYKERAAFWAKKKSIYRKEHKKSKKDGQFRPYMLNGKSGNVTNAVKKEIADGVLNFKLVVTSTSDGYPGDGVHTTSSNHYKQNHSDGKGHAVDMAGSYNNMSGFHYSRKKNAKKYAEEFGPGNFYIKNGTVYAGQFPGHTNHTHTAPY